MTDMQQQQLAAKDDEIRDLVTSDNYTGDAGKIRRKTPTRST